MKAERPSPVVAGVGAWLLILSAAVWDTRRAAPRAKAHSRPKLGAEVVDQVLQPPQEEHAEKQQRDTMMAELRQNITVTLRNEMMVELKAHDEQTRKMARVGFVPVAAHAELAARVAQLEHTNAELAQNCSATGATAFESQKSAELIEHAVDRLGVRVLTVENLLQTNRSVDAREGRTWRQMQETTGHGEYVLQIKRNVTRCGGPGAGSLGAHFDMSRCADHTFQQCHREECIGFNGDHSHGKGGGKHRRAQVAGPCNLPLRTAALNAACCQAPEDCAGGGPQTCTDACAGQLLPFWKECGPVLGQDTVEVLGPVVSPNGSSMDPSMDTERIRLREKLCLPAAKTEGLVLEHRWRCASASPRSPSSSTSGARTAHRPPTASRNAAKTSTARSSSSTCDHRSKC